MNIRTTCRRPQTSPAAKSAAVITYGSIPSLAVNSTPTCAPMRLLSSPSFSVVAIWSSVLSP